MMTFYRDYSILAASLNDGLKNLLSVVGEIISLVSMGDAWLFSLPPVRFSHDQTCQFLDEDDDVLLGGSTIQRFDKSRIIPRLTITIDERILTISIPVPFITTISIFRDTTPTTRFMSFSFNYLHSFYLKSSLEVVSLNNKPVALGNVSRKYWPWIELSGWIIKRIALFCLSSKTLIEFMR